MCAYYLSEDCCYAYLRVNCSVNCGSLFSYSLDCSTKIAKDSHRHLEGHLFRSGLPPKGDNCLQLIEGNCLYLKKFGCQLLQQDCSK